MDASRKRRITAYRGFQKFDSQYNYKTIFGKRRPRITLQGDPGGFRRIRPNITMNQTENLGKKYFDEFKRKT